MYNGTSVSHHPFLNRNTACSSSSIASVGQMNAHAPQPMHFSMSISNGRETLRSMPRPLNPIAFAPTISLQTLTQSPQRMHFSFPSTKRGFSIPISFASLRRKGTPGHRASKRLNNKPADLLHPFRIGFNAYSFLNREIACGNKLSPAAFFHLDGAEPACSVRLKPDVMAQSWNCYAMLRGNVNQRRAILRFDLNAVQNEFYFLVSCVVHITSAPRRNCILHNMNCTRCISRCL